MVAYSFNSRFHDAVSSGEKTQTVRAFRKRHARVGEPVQLYAGMRTKHCRKLVDPDPICTAVYPIVIDIVDLADSGFPIIDQLWIDNIALIGAEVEAFAKADGFVSVFTDPPADILMAKFWLQNHGYGRFEGVLIQWEAGE